MSNTLIQDKANEFIDALHQLEQGSVDDANQLVALFADDATIANSALDNRGKQLSGSSEVLQFWVEYKETLGQVKSEFHHITTSENAAGLFWTTSGQNASGDEVHYHGSTLLQFNTEGKIEFFRGYYDTRELNVTGRE